ncbi:ankyrin repeat domain-containing protein [Pedobacter sp. AW1-32]|uniref:ankyrin repeat domain-containing protein n=1 Tax=Pedobacter sp. AW1-32 TaxID=3383026 RepID=UPI003FEDF646
MKNGKVLLIIIFLLSCNHASKNENDIKFLGDDYRLFKKTPIWKLAQAISAENLSKAEHLVKYEKFDLNSQEPTYGKTLLMLTVLNQQFSSCRKLLELGANPNIHDNYDGSSAIIAAAAVNGDLDDNTRFLRLLVQFHANVNDIEKGRRRDDNLSRVSPLMVASSSVNKIVSPIKKVQFLVENGADVNYISEFNQTALSQAALHDNYDVVAYLLKNKADAKIPILFRNDKAVYLSDFLREKSFTNDSIKIRGRLQILEILKKQN